MIRAKTIAAALAAAFAAGLAACNEIRRPAAEPYLAPTKPPARQELRWTNGPPPRTLDPAKAASAPETDVVRAIFEGLTELDPTNLEALPAVSEAWSSSDDSRVWTFKLRTDAKWSDGRMVTADDFVRSWKRLHQLGNEVGHANLLDNFALLSAAEKDEHETPPSDFEAAEPLPSPSAAAEPQGELKPRLNVIAEDEKTLVLHLVNPDPDLPKLLTHPIFRPVARESPPEAVTNGPFRIIERSGSEMVLEPSETYWNRAAVKLDSVRFVFSNDPESALESYRRGHVDVVTNAALTGLAQKVLSPYADYRRSAFAALNFYEVNYRKPPFSDRRVRTALAMAIEREKLPGAENEGVVQPAVSFMPFSSGERSLLVQDKERARELLDEAGFPNGVGFPPIRLVINRNETQQQVARAVAAMWKANLNLDTEVIERETAEIPAVRESGDYDLIRRGVVLPVPDETASMMAIFGGSGEPVRRAEPRIESSPTPQTFGTPNIPEGPILTEQEAIYQMRAIPLYFPTTFALVRPYVVGFDANSLDLVSLSDVSIDNNWQPKP